MVKDIAKQDNRVIGVINKCDMKQAQSDSWVNVQNYHHNTY